MDINFLKHLKKILPWMESKYNIHNQKLYIYIFFYGNIYKISETKVIKKTIMNFWMK